MKITACWITKNEESNIKRSIEGVMAVADEMIVVDTGSTDGTVAAAEALGARVEYFEWINDFSAARNFALDQCSGDIVIFQDADEWYDPALTSEDREKITALFVSNPNVMGLRTSLNSLNMQTSVTISTGTVCRIYRNRPDIRYKNRIHESITFPKNTTNVHITDAFQAKHSGYSAELMPGKISRNLEMLETAATAAPVGSDERARELMYLVRELYFQQNFQKSHNYLYEALEYPSALERACRGITLEFANTLYAGMSLSAVNRGRTSRRSVKKKLFELFRKVYPDYPGTPALDALYQMLFDLKEDSFVREFDAAMKKVAALPPNSANYYKDQERAMYAAAANAAWRRGDAMKAMDYAVAAMTNNNLQAKPLSILLNVVKGQPPDAVIALLNSLFNHNDPRVINFLTQGTFMDGHLMVHSYYLRNFTDKREISFDGTLSLLLFHGKYEAFVSQLLENTLSDTPEKITTVKYLFYAAVCGAPAEYIEPYIDLFQGYAHIYRAFQNNERLAEVTQADANILTEAFKMIACTADAETADRYLDVFRANPTLCYIVKAAYCDNNNLYEWLLREKMDGISELDFTCRRYAIQASISVALYEDALAAIARFFDAEMIEPELLHMLLVIAEKASGSTQASARKLYSQTLELYDRTVDLQDVVNTGIVFDDGGVKMRKALRVMTRAQFDKWTVEEKKPVVTAKLLELYRKAAAVYLEKDLPTEAARCLCRVAAAGKASPEDYETLADTFTKLQNTVLPGYFSTMVTVASERA
jgi:glycosyltransferase involved in cell wall biosynthesis